MKKLLPLLIVVGIVFFIGCVGSGDETPSAPPGAPSSAGWNTSSGENAYVPENTNTGLTQADIDNLGTCGWEHIDTGSLCPTLESLVSYISKDIIDGVPIYRLNITEDIQMGQYTVHSQEAECNKGEYAGENINYYYCYMSNGGYGGGITGTITDNEGNILVEVKNDAALIFSIENNNYVYRGTKCQRNAYECEWYNID